MSEIQLGTTIWHLGTAGSNPLAPTIQVGQGVALLSVVACTIVSELTGLSPSGQEPSERSRSSISQAWSSICQAQRRIRNWTGHLPTDPATAPRALNSRIPEQNVSR